MSFETRSKILLTELKRQQGEKQVLLECIAVPGFLRTLALSARRLRRRKAHLPGCPDLANYFFPSKKTLAFMGIPLAYARLRRVLGAKKMRSSSRAAMELAPKDWQYSNVVSNPAAGVIHGSGPARLVKNNCGDSWGCTFAPSWRIGVAQI
jgi:hypothetical protein